MAAGKGTLVLVTLVAAAAAAGVSALLVNIMERKQEGRRGSFRVVEITDTTDDPAVWGQNFPLHYDDYKKTVDMERTRYGGSEAMPQRPTGKDPRRVVSQSKIEEEPRLRTMWAGYAFSVDFREERGHAYMLSDQEYTRRVLEFKQPGTCLNCHSSIYTAHRKAGNGNLEAGFHAVNKLPYAEARKLVEHPVGCIDCHDPKTMQLRITRHAFVDGIRAYKASQGVAGYDVNTMATAIEMRSYVCGQCHVEYYFKGPEKTLTFPWSKGLKADQIYSYYEDVQFNDWVHKDTGAKVLKAQHPEFEMWNQGVHARSGVTCADCHMPYKRVGGTKISDHHVRSPMLNINRACQGCHHQTEQEMQSRVDQIHERMMETRNLAMDALMDLIADIRKRKDAGASGAELAEAQSAQRKAQFFVDFVEAENSAGFHAPQEAMRVLAMSIDTSRKGQVALRALPAK
jgi:nitrite reductase (cytochrome c-552)